MKKSFNATQNNPVNAYFLTLSDETINSYTYRIGDFYDFVFGDKDFKRHDWSQVSYVTVLAFLKHEKTKKKAYTTINVTLSAIKGVALHAWQLKLISLEEYIKIKQIKKLKGQRQPAGRALEVQEVHRIIEHSTRGKELIEVRDRAIFALGVGAGLRRSEIAALDKSDIKEDRIEVIGKFNKARIVFLTPFTRKALKNWLKVHTGEQALFVRIFKNNKLGKRLTKLSIHRSIERVAKKSKSARFTSHDLRRTFITSLLDNDADKFSVKRLAGHTNLNTTEIYDRRHEKTDKVAVNLLPY